MASPAVLSAGLLLGCGAQPDGAALDGREAQERQRLRNLKALPYVESIPVSADENDGVGVTVHDPTRAQTGVNLFTPRDAKTAYLVDMDGSVRHTWSVEFPGDDGIHHVEPLAGGALLAVFKDVSMVHVSWGSEVEWVSRERFHHDAAVSSDGRIFAPCRDEAIVRADSGWVPILDDSVCVLSPSGELERRISLFDVFVDRLPDRWDHRVARWARAENREDLLRRGATIVGGSVAEGSPPDLFHLNSVQVVRRPVAGICSEGDLLVSLRQLDTIAFIDPSTGGVRWTWGPGHLQAQHHPTLLDTGNILVFDNGRRRGSSRVLEMDPSSGEIVWVYEGDPPVDFFSQSRGACQRLPNGNTLITESDGGRAFEVTTDGEVVWELLSPVRTDLSWRGFRKTRAPIYRMRRLAEVWGPERPLRWSD